MANAVKHFKFAVPERGKRRIHQKPARTEVVACRPWLLAEIHAIDPEIVVCLGATAAQSLLGTSFRITRHRGELLEWDAGDLGLDAAPKVVTTTHPSAILRAPDDQRKQA